jgi:hypothetical protein
MENGKFKHLQVVETPSGKFGAVTAERRSGNPPVWQLLVKCDITAGEWFEASKLKACTP